MDSKKWCYDRRLRHDEVTRKIRTEHMAKQNASGFLELDRIEAGLLCLLAMREGEKQLTYRGRLGLLVTLWFSLREVIGREHRRGRWASCRPKAYNGDFIIGLGFGLGEDGLVRMLRCGQKACRLHIYHLDIVVALWLGIREHGFEVIRKQLPKWNGAGSGVLRKCRPDVVGWASGYFYCLGCSTSQHREVLDKKKEYALQARWKLAGK